MSKYGWYWGPLPKKEAEEKLCDKPDGAFLVRDSGSQNYCFTLSVRCMGKTLHVRIEYLYGKYALLHERSFSSVAELIHKSMVNSKDQMFGYSRWTDGSEPMYPVRLVKPISRFTHVRSLQYLCRFVIRQTTTINNIKELPLPSTVKEYLEQGFF